MDQRIAARAGGRRSAAESVHVVCGWTTTNDRTVNQMATWERVRESGRVSERIVRQIEHQLDNGSLRPGDQLPTERDLAQRVGASRASVREAYRILQARGRLEIRHGVGVFVAVSATLAGLGDSLRRRD